MPKKLKRNEKVPLSDAVITAMAAKSRAARQVVEQPPQIRVSTAKERTLPGTVSLGARKPPKRPPSAGGLAVAAPKPKSPAGGAGENRKIPA
jgi:hypothetical protein